VGAFTFPLGAGNWDSYSLRSPEATQTQVPNAARLAKLKKPASFCHGEYV